MKMRKDKKDHRNAVTGRIRKLCSCLISEMSDDEGYSEEAYFDGPNSLQMEGQDVGNIGARHSDHFRSSRSSVSCAVATTQQPGPSRSLEYRHNLDDSDDNRYVVYTSVDYTNCLVPSLDKILAAPYYWGVMNRYEAEDLLNNKPEGTFLLRDSAQSEYLFSVSFRRYKRTLHARIEQKNHYFSFDFSDSSLYSASNITDLIAYYNDATKCLFYEPQLTIPLPRNYVFSLQNLCRARIASLTTYDGIGKLSLPQILKDYVREYYYKHPVKTTNHAPPLVSSQVNKLIFRQAT